MKIIILALIIFLLTLTGCGKERVEDMSKYKTIEGIAYVMGEDKPYTGVFIKKYKNGLLHGETKSYFENGDLLVTRFYVNGKPEGTHKDYYENGNLKSEVTYEDGKMITPVKFYKENGEPE